MSFNLLLDSSLAKQQRNNHNQKSHDFTIYFNPPIQLDPRKNYKAALNRLITMSYSWYNIAEAYWKQQNQVAKEHRRLANFDVS